MSVKRAAGLQSKELDGGSKRPRLEVQEEKPAAKCDRKARYLALYDRECPTSKADIEALVTEHQLCHGDVVAFNDYRDIDSHIVYRQEDGTMTLLPNPDYAAAGYLTIPKEVLANVHDAVSFYGDVITEDSPSVILPLSPHDKFVVDRLGQVPDDWEFTVEFDWGELESFDVKVPGHEWESFDPSTVNRETIDKRFFSGTPLVTLCVKVDLKGKECREYESKYGRVGAKHPNIPSSWLIEEGGRQSGEDHRMWRWNLSGPQSEKEEARQSIMDFLKGFTYHFE